MKTLRMLLLLGLALLAAPAQALNILVSNDDGFETANLRALVQRLRAAGHDVIASGPTQNNSGKGGAMNFLQPLGALSRDSRYASVHAGAPGVGRDPADADVWYVDGTPVMAVLHGLDVLAPQRWQAQPDLVISGPNEGSNTGLINNSSGTVNNALYAINRGIPAIAASYEGTSSRAHTALAAGAIEYELAELLVRLVAELERQRSPGQPLLPPGTGLNLNVPKFASGQAASLAYRYARMGLASDYQPVFFDKLSDSALARGFGAGVPLPGISFANEQIPPPAGVTIPRDADPRSERNRMRSPAVAVTVIEGLPQARRSNEDLVRLRLRALLSPEALATTAAPALGGSYEALVGSERAVFSIGANGQVRGGASACQLSGQLAAAPQAAGAWTGQFRLVGCAAANGSYQATLFADPEAQNARFRAVLADADKIVDLYVYPQ